MCAEFWHRKHTTNKKNDGIKLHLALNIVVLNNYFYFYLAKIQNHSEG